MAVRIFVEKENELLSTHTKNHPRLLSSSSITDTSLLRTPQSGKMLTATPHLQQSARKALRDVNCSLRAGSKTGNSQKKKPDKVHKKISTTNFVKSTEKPSILEPTKTEDYPEIETFIPYDPFDFEDFNVPEEHRLDHICLAGLPLFCLEKEETLLKNVLNKIPSPLEWPSLTKESNLMDFDMNADVLGNLDEIGEVELPMMEDDF